MTDWATALTAASPRQRERLTEMVRKYGDPVGVFPVSSAQKRIWFVERFGAAGITFHTTLPLEIDGRLDPEILRRAVGAIVRRHQVLRTTFPIMGDTPMQVIWPAPDDGRIDIPETDVSAEKHLSDAAIHALLVEEQRRPFDLAEGPLFRARLFRLAPEASILLFTVHHIVFDEPSCPVLVDELAELYTAFAHGRGEPLAPLPWQYADFAVWQHDQRFEREFAYWRRELGDAPTTLDLPTDRPRPPLPDFEAGTVELTVPTSARDRLGRLAMATKSTPFMILLAAFGCLLCRYSRQEEVLVGTPMAARERAETRRLIGVFVNMLALRVDLSGDPTFRQLLHRVRDSALGAYSHQGLPFEKVVQAVNPRRDNSRGPLLQAVIVLWGGRPKRAAVPGAVLRPMRLGTGTVQSDVALLFDAEPDALRGEFRYSRALFEPATARGMAGDLESILYGALDDPDRPVSTLAAPALRRRSIDSERTC
ncbi:MULTISPECIES: condensation domain-containing protein [unclassified Nocardia]|uniref:condensation domain-containing protein n=1 Tax=unclassified Nocardia TaxID=2637762 RepID=UPI001CE48D39|nr:MULTISPECIES: condensation domain-containing protein [unclassified Nocardia]